MQNVVPDDSAVKVPGLGLDDRRALNRQTAYGRPVLEGSARRCGCFRCGSTFSSAEICNWMAEKDGPDTALCPYCGCDAVIYGTPRLPLSTALLSRLHLDWFSREHRERERMATYAPPFASYDDYLRRGVPFLLEARASLELAGEVNLFCESGCDGEGGPVRIVARGAGDIELADERGRCLPYVVMGARNELLVLDLAEKYGPRLRGLIVNPYDRRLRLVVARL